MDDGPDSYAAVSWDNPEDRYGSRYAIAWVNNWDYAAILPYYGDFEGQLSLIREVKLKTVDGSPTLVSKPIGGCQTAEDSVSVKGKTITTDPATESLLGNLTDGAYVVHATISKGDADDGDEIRFRIKIDGSFSTTIGYSFANSEGFLDRSSDGSATDSLAADPKRAYETIRTASNPSGTKTVKLDIYVDWNLVEMFVDDGVAVLSGLIYPNEGARGMEVVSEKGSLTLVSLSQAGCKE